MRPDTVLHRHEPRAHCTNTRSDCHFEDFIPVPYSRNLCGPLRIGLLRPSLYHHHYRLRWIVWLGMQDTVHHSVSRLKGTCSLFGENRVPMVILSSSMLLGCVRRFYLSVSHDTLTESVTGSVVRNVYSSPLEVNLSGTSGPIVAPCKKEQILVLLLCSCSSFALSICPCVTSGPLLLQHCLYGDATLK